VALRILLVDPDSPMRRAWAKPFVRAGFEVLTAEDGAAARALLTTAKPDVVFVELGVFEADSATFRGIKRPFVLTIDPTRLEPEEPKVDGAFAWLTRELRPPPGLPVLAASAARPSPERHAPAQATDELVAVAPAARRARDLARSAADGHASVLLVGEPGVGKRTLARLCHRAGARGRAPLIEVACEAIGEGSIVRELFDRDGAIARAADGSVLIDRVDTLPLEAQRALVTALADRTRRARVLATATPQLRDAVKSGAFLSDAFFSLAGVVIDVPPLRLRRDDIPVMAHVFARHAAEAMSRAAPRLSTEALRRVRGADWPGNIPELEAAIVRGVSSMTGDSLMPGDLGALPGEREPVPRDLRPYVEARSAQIGAFESDYVERLLTHTGGNLTRAAAIAGMDRANFRRMVRRVRGSE